MSRRVFPLPINLVGQTPKGIPSRHARPTCESLNYRRRLIVRKEKALGFSPELFHIRRRHCPDYSSLGNNGPSGRNGHFASRPRICFDVAGRIGASQYPRRCSSRSQWRRCVLSSGLSLLLSGFEIGLGFKWPVAQPALGDQPPPPAVESPVVEKPDRPQENAPWNYY